MIADELHITNSLGLLGDINSWKTKSINNTRKKEYYWE